MSTLESSPTRRDVLRAALAAGGALCVPRAFAQTTGWPAKPVSIVVGYPPGGQTDFVARVLSKGMQDALGQSIIIDNKPGVNGNIAAMNVLQAAPDGHRLLAGNGIMTIAPHTYRRIQIADPLAFTPIGTMLTSGLALLVPAASPVQTYQDFVQYVREAAEKSGGIDYATSGAGGLTHVTTELWRERVGVTQMNHIPYKGGGPAAIALIGAQVAGMFEAVSVVSPFIKSGQVRALMVTTSERVPILPDVPTAAECGLADFEILSFIGFYGPPGLPADIVKTANAAMNSALSDTAIRDAIIERGDEPGGGTPEDLAKLTREQYELWGPIVRANNIYAD